MKNKKWYEWMLIVVYVAMVLLCVYLNFMPGHQESIATIIVNVVMFIIVAIIFISADLGSFIPMNSIIADLEHATAKIRNDAMSAHSYLWEPYQANNVKFFKNEKLQEIFRDFVFELNRENDAANKYYRPSIDEYVNEDLVDSTMHRNELNQVAGMLTGLGILGTFIGLSLGLQNFNTGTTAEMTSSIEPLMNGIKVAFHTSIYGMIFSLTFNVIYKKKLYEAEEAVSKFTSAFKKFVLPDMQNDGMNQLIALQENQITALDNMTFKMSNTLSKILEPHFDRLNRTIVDFENMATRNQTDAIAKVAENFIREMNRSLGNSFTEINNVVDAQYEIQKQNAGMMQEVLAATGSNNVNLNDINREMERLITTLNSYSTSIQSIQNELQKTLASLKDNYSGNTEILEREQKFLKEQERIIVEFKTAVTDYTRYSHESNERICDALEEITNGVDYIQRTIDKKQSTTNVRR